MRLNVLIALLFVVSLSADSFAWDTITKQFIPENPVERPPEVNATDEFNDLIFTRDNFYNKSAGVKQHRNAIRSPEKNMNFEVYNPVDDSETVIEVPNPETGIVEKDGKAVTVISIGEEPETDSNPE